MANTSLKNPEALKKPLTVKRPLISFVIITFNRLKFLIKCTTSITSSKLKDYEIVIINNGKKFKTDPFSKIPSKTRLASGGKNLTIITNKKNNGVAKARNQGITTSSGKFIVFIDDDAYFNNANQLKIALNYFAKNKNAGILAPIIYYPNGLVQESIRRFPTLAALLWRGSILEKLFPNSKYYTSYLYTDIDRSKIARVDWAIGACLIVKRKMFTKFGLFDENYFFGYEDVELARRLWKFKFKTIYYPNLKVVHTYQRKSNRGIINIQKLRHIKSIFHFFMTK